MLKHKMIDSKYIPKLKKNNQPPGSYKDCFFKNKQVADCYYEQIRKNKSAQKCSQSNSSKTVNYRQKHLHRNKQRKVTREELADLINNFAWQFFITATFSIEISPETGRKLWLGYLDKLEKRFQLPIPRIWFQEFSQRGDTPHYHALVARIRHIKNSAKIMWELWYKKLNYGALQTLPYDPERGANEYLTKYVGKDQFGSGDWGLDILGKL